MTTAGDRTPGDFDLTGRGRLKAHDDAQGGRLATSAWADQGNDVTLFDIEGDTVQGMMRTKGLGDVLYFQMGHVLFQLFLDACESLGAYAVIDELLGIGIAVEELELDHFIVNPLQLIQRDGQSALIALYSIASL